MGALVFNIFIGLVFVYQVPFYFHREEGEFWGGITLKCNDMQLA